MLSPDNFNLVVVVPVSSSDVFVTSAASVDIWHARLGHVPASIFQMLPIPSFNKPLDICDSCYFAKQSRLSFPDSTHVSKKKLI